MPVVCDKTNLRIFLQASALMLALLPLFAAAQTYHTSPACWQQPRIFHAGAPAAEFANRIHIIQSGADISPAGEAIVSSNNVYRFWVREVSSENPDSGVGVVIDVGRSQRPTLLLQGAVQSPAPRWLNEKLLFLRVMWGRVVFSDIIFDVEKSELVFHELVQDGTIAWQQFQQACQGRCPCELDSAIEERPMPLSQPGPDSIIGLLELPTVFGGGEAGGVVQAETSEAVTVYSAPFTTAAVLALLNTPDQWRYREIAYELGAVEVYQRQGNWFRVKISEGERYGWVQANAEQYHGLDALLPGRLSYLNANWNGELWNPKAQWSDPAEVKSIATGTDSGNAEFPVEIIEVRTNEQGVWLNVRLLSSNSCDGDLVQIVDSGWVPAYAANAALSAWYWARGC